MSTRHTSGRSRRASSTHSAPSAASPTTSMSGWAPRISRKPVRTISWSSAISTRVGPRSHHPVTVHADDPATAASTGKAALTHQPPSRWRPLVSEPSTASTRSRRPTRPKPPRPPTGPGWRACRCRVAHLDPQRRPSSPVRPVRRPPRRARGGARSSAPPAPRGARTSPPRGRAVPRGHLGHDASWTFVPSLGERGDQAVEFGPQLTRAGRPAWSSSRRTRTRRRMESSVSDPARVMFSSRGPTCSGEVCWSISAALAWTMMPVTWWATKSCRSWASSRRWRWRTGGRSARARRSSSSAMQPQAQASAGRQRTSSAGTR